MNRQRKKWIILTYCTCFSILFLLLCHFLTPTIHIIDESKDTISIRTSYKLPDGSWEMRTEEKEVGKDFTAISISDLKDLNQITKVNYVPDEFIVPPSIPKETQIVDLTRPFEFSKRGTLYFVILNLDPSREDWLEASEALFQHKIGDYWQFTFSLPQIFSASNVYLKSQLYARKGEIRDYDFINYTTSYTKKTEKFSAETDRVDLTLNFYTRRNASDRFAASQIITIHYESTGGYYAGIKGIPLIGTEDAVKAANKNDQTLLLSFTFLAIIVISILIVLSLLKHTKEFTSAILWMFGIMIGQLALFIFSQETPIPLLCMSLSSSSIFFILSGGLLGLNKFYKKIPIRYIFVSIALFGALLAFICPYISYEATNIILILCSVIKGIAIVALVAGVILFLIQKENEQSVFQMICVLLISFIGLTSLILPERTPIYSNTLFWLNGIAIIVTFISIFIVFKDTEKRNSYLTANLHLEIDRQIQDIKSVIKERDNLLQFVSHDMKKPLTASASLIDNLIERESNNEQKKVLHIVKQNTSRVITNLSEIGTYTRFNYIAEPSTTIDLYDLVKKMFEFHQPDCNANGIILKNLINKSYKVFVKQQGLENAVSNIILNAVEHSNCTTITLSAKTDKNRILLSIIDNGKGIDSTFNIFEPYSSGKSKNDGIGLYICKNIIESMNGQLSYTSKEGQTIFNISLLKM